MVATLNKEEVEGKEEGIGNNSLKLSWSTATSLL